LFSRSGSKAVAAGQWPEAERHLREVARVSPNFALAWSGLGYALQSQQKPVEAREAYGRAIAADPASLLPRVQLVRMQVAAKLWTETSASAAALIKADKEHRYPEAHFHLGMARYMLQDYEGARAALEEGVKADTRHEMPQAEYLLGAALSAKGDRAGAGDGGAVSHGTSLSFPAKRSRRIVHEPHEPHERPSSLGLVERNDLRQESACTQPPFVWFVWFVDDFLRPGGRD